METAPKQLKSDRSSHQFHPDVRNKVTETARIAVINSTVTENGQGKQIEQSRVSKPNATRLQNFYLFQDEAPEE